MKDVVSFPDFAKLDLRVGKIVSAEKVEGSEKLLRMKVDLGSDYGVRTIFAGLALWYKPADLTEKKFVFVANLEPKMMFGSQSQGMMLAICPDSGKPELLPVKKKITEGTTVR